MCPGALPKLNRLIFNNLALTTATLILGADQSIGALDTISLGIGEKPESILAVTG